MRRAWVPVAAAVAAAAVVLAASLAASPDYRTQMTIVVGHGNGPLSPETGNDRALAEALRELIESRSVAAAVVDNLDLEDPPEDLLDRMSVDVPQPGVLEVAVTDNDRARVRQVAQEIGLVFSALVSARFGASRPGGERTGAAPLSATIWDPPSEPEEISRRPVRNAALAGALGFVVAAGGVALASRKRRREPIAVPPVPAPLPLRLPPVAEQTPAEVPTTTAPESAPEPRAAPAPEPAPVPGPATGAPRSAPVPAAPGEWNLSVLERLVAERAAAFPSRVDEWGYYLMYLRDYAAVDGRLPSTFDALVADVFADLLEPEPA